MVFDCYICTFFFFKQKTAYEMRISDWSSDVCSSDLPVQPVPARPVPVPVLRQRQPPDLRPCHSAPSGRTNDVGKHRQRLRAVQHEEGRAHAPAGAYAPSGKTDPADQLAIAAARPPVPAQLPARNLARLALLGHRAGGVVKFFLVVASGAKAGPQP